MNWIVFTITAYVFFALERGLFPLLAIPNQYTGVAPSFLLILLVFIGLQAQPMTVAWAALALGLLNDLIPQPDGLRILGPAALGYLVGSYAVVQLRTLLFRDSTLTLAIMVFAVGIFVNLVEVAIYSIRQWGVFSAEDIAGWSAPGQLVSRFLALLYTTIVALPIGYMLVKTTPLWNFSRSVRAERVY